MTVLMGELPWSDSCCEGLDMVEEKFNEAGSSVGWFCKLCEREIAASFGKMQHCKTRGHRQQFKVN